MDSRRLAVLATLLCFSLYFQSLCFQSADIFLLLNPPPPLLRALFQFAVSLPSSSPIMIKQLSTLFYRTHSSPCIPIFAGTFNKKHYQALYPHPNIPNKAPNTSTHTQTQGKIRTHVEEGRGVDGTCRAPVGD